MQFLQYFAVFTQIIYGGDSHLNVTRSQTSVNSETVTTHPVDVQSKIEINFDISTVSEDPLATSSVIFKMTDHPKKFTLPPLPYAYDVSKFFECVYIGLCWLTGTRLWSHTLANRSWSCTTPSITRHMLII